MRLGEVFDGDFLVIDRARGTDADGDDVESLGAGGVHQRAH